MIQEDAAPSDSKVHHYVVSYINNAPPPQPLPQQNDARQTRTRGAFPHDLHGGLLLLRRRPPNGFIMPPAPICRPAPGRSLLIIHYRGGGRRRLLTKRRVRLSKQCLAAAAPALRQPLGTRTWRASEPSRNEGGAKSNAVAICYVAAAASGGSCSRAAAAATSSTARR